MDWEYKGVKCVIPVKWALLAMKDSMDFKSRGDLTSKYYDNLEELTCEFQSRCYSIILVLQQPVPFAYFHVLKLQMLIVLSLVAYALVRRALTATATSVQPYAYIVTLCGCS